MVKKFAFIGLVMLSSVFGVSCSLNSGGACTSSSPVSPSCNPNQPDPLPVQNPPQEGYDPLGTIYPMMLDDDPNTSSIMTVALIEILPMRGSFIKPPGCPDYCFTYYISVSMGSLGNDWSRGGVNVYSSNDGITPIDPLLGGGVLNGKTAILPDASPGFRIQYSAAFKYLLVKATWAIPGTTIRQYATRVILVDYKLKQ